MPRLVLKAQLAGGPVQVVGDEEFTDDEWAETIEPYGSAEDFLQNAGSDWAYEAAHSDNLTYWAEVEE